MIYDSSTYNNNIAMTARSNISWNKLKEKSVLIAGATGLVGRYLIDLIMYKNSEEDLNCHIFAVSRNSETAKNLLRSDFWDSELFTYIQADISSTVLPREIFNFCYDYVINLASNTHPVAYAKRPIETIISNIYGTKSLLDIVSATGNSRFVLTSSVEIYGENRGDTEMFDESYLGYLNSNTMRAGYPESKRVCETLCQSYIAEKNTDAVIVRLPRLFGPTMSESDSKALAQFIKKAVMGSDVVLKSEGNQFYSYLYVGDAVTGMLKVMLDGVRGEAYNLADESSNVTLRDAALKCTELAGTNLVFDLPNETEKAGFSTATKALLDHSKINSLGWKASTSFSEGLTITFNTLREAGTRFEV